MPFGSSAIVAVAKEMDATNIDDLHPEIHVSGTALKWFSSFLKSRTMRVKVNGAYSEVFELEFGVPQGPVLGPILFNIYIRSIYKHIERIGFSIKGFADDHQIYVSFSPEFQLHYLCDKIKSVMELIEKLMNYYFLKLNQSKTQIIVFGPESVRKMVTINGAFIENDKTCIRFKSIVKNLGVFMDASMTYAEQIKKSCFLFIFISQEYFTDQGILDYKGEMYTAVLVGSL